MPIFQIHKNSMIITCMSKILELLWYKQFLFHYVVQQGTSVTDDTDSCIYPSCTRKRHIEPNGTVHPYCGKTHANLAKSLGIFCKFICVSCKLHYCSKCIYS